MSPLFPDPYWEYRSGSRTVKMVSKKQCFGSASGSARIRIKMAAPDPDPAIKKEVKINFKNEFLRPGFQRCKGNPGEQTLPGKNPLHAIAAT